MIKYDEIITIKQTNKFLDILLTGFVFASLFFSLNSKIMAMVQTYLEFSPTAEFQFNEFSKENQETITIANKKNVDKIFFNGIESRDKVTVPLQEGENSFSFTLTGHGKEVEKSVRIIKDTKVPEIDSKFGFTDTKTKSTPFSFELSLNEDGSVVANDKPCVKNEKFICSIEVKDKTSVKVIVSDKAGNQIEKDFTVELDSMSPDITLNAESPTIQSKGYINVKSNEPLQSVKIKDLKAEKKDEVTYGLEVNLDMGANSFEVIAIDLAGNETKKSISIERKEPPPVQNNSGNGGGSYTPPSNNGGSQPPVNNGCSSISMNLYNVQTPVFVGETQSATVKLTCGNGQGYGGQTVSITIRYSDGSTQNYSATTNGSGIANFSFAVPDKKGNATMTAKYSVSQTSVVFEIN